MQTTRPRNRQPLRLAILTGDQAADQAREIERQVRLIQHTLATVRRADQNVPALVSAVGRQCVQVADLAGQLAGQLDQVREAGDATAATLDALRRRLDQVERRLERHGHWPAIVEEIRPAIPRRPAI